MVSCSFAQNWHVSSSRILRFTKFDFVGKASEQALHRRCSIFQEWTSSIFPSNWVADYTGCMTIFIVAAFLTQHFIPRSYCVIAKAVQRPKQKIILGQWTQRDSLDKLSFVRGKEESIKLCFHSLVCWSISTSAVLLSGKELFGAITRLPLLSISHESPKILILHPSPTRQSPPWDLTFLAFKMLLHAYEPKFFFASKIEPLGKYFALNTL